MSFATLAGARIPHGASGGDPYWADVILFYQYLASGPYDDTSPLEQAVTTHNELALAAGPFPVTAPAYGSFEEFTDGGTVFVANQVVSTGNGGLWSPASFSPFLLTVDAWHYITSAPNSIFGDTIWAWGTNDGVFNCRLGTRGSSPAVSFVVAGGQVDTGVPVSKDAWHFFRTLFTAADTAEIWMDGVNIATVNFSGGNHSTSAFFCVGPTTTSQNQAPYDAFTSQVRVTKGVLRDGTEVPTAPFPAHGV